MIELNEKEAVLVGLMMSIIASIFLGDEQSMHGLLDVLAAQTGELGPLYERFSEVVDSPEAQQLLDKYQLERITPITAS